MWRSLHQRRWSTARTWWRWSAPVCGVLILGMVPASAAGTPVKVFDKKDINEAQPAMSDGFLVWWQGRATYVKPDGEPRVRINPVGTQSFVATIDGTTVVYQSIANDQARLQMYDAVTGARSSPPEGVNTPAFEADPSLSGDWLLFTRVGPRRARVILFNLDTLEQRVLENLATRSHYLTADQVNGDWATFESCDFDKGTYSNCQAHRYQISTDLVARIPNPDRQQYAAGITDDGTAYLVSTVGSDVWNCGAGAELVRQPVSGSREVIATLPEGFDSFNTFAFEGSDGSVTLLFDRIRCNNGASGIYQVEDANTP